MLAVVGAGAMGTALAVQLHRAGNEVALLATKYDDLFVEAHRRGEDHPAIGVPFPPAPLHTHDDWAGALSRCEAVVLAVSTAGLITTVEEAAHHTGDDALWAVGTKGWDEKTLRSASSVVADALGDEKRVVALVGPSLAGELAAGVPTALVFASADRANSARVAAMFSSKGFRTYLSDDVAGVEVGAALKNVIAIGIGLCDGVAEAFTVETMNNAKAFIFARGLIEMAELARASGGRPETVIGLAGAGDLFVTALGGRNARFGALVGGGTSPEDALKEMATTVEGYVNGHAAVALADKHGLASPVIRTVARVIYDGFPPREAIIDLIRSDGPHEESDL
ncbi:MAG: NAD(P)H-dependent glycerol-3-phosphate dehydrogenase [Actinomycetota bacterium]|nr:NAD(P)H-dependent glycerol-3-phosphate dehydrogenase [Actinomycetota bacterium]